MCDIGKCGEDRKALPNKNIFFIPDRNLAHYIAELAPEKHFVYNRDTVRFISRCVWKRSEKRKKTIRKRLC